MKSATLCHRFLGGQTCLPQFWASLYLLCTYYTVGYNFWDCISNKVVVAIKNRNERVTFLEDILLPLGQNTRKTPKWDLAVLLGPEHHRMELLITDHQQKAFFTAIACFYRWFCAAKLFAKCMILDHFLWNFALCLAWQQWHGLWFMWAVSNPTYTVEMIYAPNQPINQTTTTILLVNVVW